VKALLLDLDDTLLDYSGGVDLCWEEACATAAPSVERPRLLQALVETRRWFWSDPGRHRRERVDMLRAWTRIAAAALERSGGDPAHAAPLAEDYAARRRAAMRLFPDALDLLERLRTRGVRMGLVTNGDARQQWDKIERHALGRFFDAIVVEGEFGAGKPDAVVYRAALDGIGVAPTDAWMVGDHLEFDVDGPQRLGVQGVWLDREGLGLPAGSTVRPSRIVRSLSELP
jgi:putative hydrolase of the HAD superfamily